MKLGEKYNMMPRQAKASLWYTVCNVLQKGIMIIAIPIYTRMLTAAEYGQYTVFQSWRDILIIFATLNLYCGVFTKAMVDYEDDRNRYTACMQGLTTVITLLLCGAYLVGRSFWNSVLGMDTVTILLLFLYFITFPALSFWSVRQRVEYKYKALIAVTLCLSVMTLVISVLLLVLTDLRANAIIWGFLLVQCAGGLFFYVFQFVRGKTFFVKDYWVHALKFNIPLIPHYLSLIVLAQADRIMIKEYCGEAKAGIYALAYQISMAMNIFITAVNNTLVPWTYECLKKKCYGNVKKVCNSICFFLMFAVAGTMLVAPEIIRILGTSEYLDAVWIVPSVTISTYVVFCYGLFSNVEFYYSATKYVMVASVVGAILNVGLNAIFIPRYGFIAAGYTTLLCYVVFFAMHFWFMCKICKKETAGNLIFDIRFILVSCIMLCAMGAACLLLYNGYWLRYIVVLAIGLILFTKRKQILSLLSTVKR